MYVVTNSKGDVIAICSSHADAMAYKSAETIDNETYTIKEVKSESKSDKLQPAC